MGPQLAPDYLTSVRDGGFYGWPYSYWGQNVDPRVRPQNPDMMAKAIVPGYAMGSHVAALVGVAFDPKRRILLIADDLSNTVWRVAPARLGNSAPFVSPKRTERPDALACGGRRYRSRRRTRLRREMLSVLRLVCKLPGKDRRGGLSDLVPVADVLDEISDIF